jgi:hypothetical protein
MMRRFPLNLYSAVGSPSSAAFCALVSGFSMVKQLKTLAEFNETLQKNAIVM